MGASPQEVQEKLTRAKGAISVAQFASLLAVLVSVTSLVLWRDARNRMIEKQAPPSAAKKTVTPGELTMKLLERATPAIKMPSFGSTLFSKKENTEAAIERPKAKEPSALPWETTSSKKPVAKREKAPEKKKPVVKEPREAPKSLAAKPKTASSRHIPTPMIPRRREVPEVGAPPSLDELLAR